MHSPSQSTTTQFQLPAILFALGVLLNLTSAAEKPNVLFFSVDDLNDWIEPLGDHPQAITPNLKRLASQSVTFTRNYFPSQSEPMPDYYYPTPGHTINMPKFKGM